jgi:hypothetical protein
LDGVGSGTSCFPAVSEPLGFLREDRDFRAIFLQCWGAFCKESRKFLDRKRETNHRGLRPVNLISFLDYRHVD